MNSPTPPAPDAPIAANKLSANPKAQRLYRLRLADCPADVEAAQRLRYNVFNVEMGEGLASAETLGLDIDRFDAVCDHILVEEAAGGMLVGTYRVQMGSQALAAGSSGFYSAQEFDFSPFLPHAAQIVELGRACVHKAHRNLIVLGLLWKGIVLYTKERGGRYLMGCSSLTSQDPAEGLALFAALKERYFAAPQWQTRPMPGYECVSDAPAAEAPKVPKLMSAYFAVGAKICSAPAVDREFKTIDFLTWVDVTALPPSVAARYGIT